jgi:hypothetical protein
MYVGIIRRFLIFIIAMEEPRADTTEEYSDTTRTENVWETLRSEENK